MTRTLARLAVAATWVAGTVAALALTRTSPADALVNLTDRAAAALTLLR